MKRGTLSLNRGRAMAARLLAAATVLASLGGGASARELAPMAELERAFWVCDHAASRQMVGAGMAASCSTATEELKKQKFDGSFDAMLAWWRQHKEPEHRALDAAGKLAGR